MHLWPSMRLRDSFKNAYLKKLEWNLHRMNIEKQLRQKNQSGSSEQQKLLETDASHSRNSSGGGIVLLCREILMILSCCYCCFCCGACVEDEESS